MVQDLASKVSKGNVKVLRTGTTKTSKENIIYSPCTITLIDHYNGKYSLINPGSIGEEKKILELVNSEGVAIQDIENILITNNHLAYMGNIHIFDLAKVFTPNSISKVESPNYFQPIDKKLFDNSYPINDVNVEIRIEQKEQEMSIFYNYDKGTIAIVGDLFWNEEDWYENPVSKKTFSKVKEQDKHRSWIKYCVKPEVVIPGHGSAFKPKY